MSTNIFEDMFDMHSHYEVHDWEEKKLAEEDLEAFEKLLEFRLAFLQEELDETKLAYENRDPEEIVDGLIDLIVIAAGTLDMYKVDGDKAWNEVFKANMKKKVGVKESRPNPLGLPDLIKPDDWEAPDHSDNHGILPDILDR